MKRDKNEGAVSSASPRVRSTGVLSRIAHLGSSAQAAIPGVYAWGITVVPAAWSRGAPVAAKVAAMFGLLALLTAPLVESRIVPTEEPPSQSLRSWTGATWARIWSVWGFVLASATVWALAPSALSSARVDAVRGALGMVGWALFAFASAGPAVHPGEEAKGRTIASAALKPRSSLPRGDAVYVAVGTAFALAMQAVGWGIVVAERAVLVRLVTVTAGIAIIGASTSIALSRHAARIPASGAVRIRRVAPWAVMLALFVGAGVVLLLAR